MRILLVEDERKVASFIARALKENTYAVDVVETGEKAIEAGAEVTYDAILLDIRLPGMSGIEVARQLKHEPDPPRVIVITISTDAAYAVAARQAGADGFLTKSACRTQLIPLIQSLFTAPM